MKGIYKIEIGDRYYIGKSVNIGSRWKQHMKKLISGEHVNTNLQKIVDELGINNLSFSIVELTDDIDIREAYYMSITDEDKLLNSAKLSLDGDGDIVWEGSKDCYIYDKTTKQCIHFSSKSKCAKWLGLTLKYIYKKRDKPVTIKGRYIFYEKPITPSLLHEYLNKYNVYLYDKDGNFVEEFSSPAKLLEKKNIKSIRYDLNSLIDKKWRISKKFLGDKIYPIEQKWGYSHEVTFDVYDLNLNLVGSPKGIKKYSKENKLNLQAIQNRLKGNWVHYKGDRLVEKFTRYYRGKYYINKDGDIKKWIKDNEYQLHLNRGGCTLS